MELPPGLSEQEGELWFTCPEGDNSTQQFRIRTILHEETTPFQHLMMLDTYDYGTALVLDGIIQTTAMDGFVYNEMISHAALSLLPNAENVLIIGGGDLGVAREVMKYPAIKRVDMVEIDAAVVKACRQFLPEVAGDEPLDERLHIHFADGVEFVATTDTHYDVIIVDSSDPIGPAVELFSQPFYQNLKRCLNPAGILSCQSLSPYYSMIMLRHIRDVLGMFFPVVATCQAVIPTYAGGLYSFTLATREQLPDYRAESVPDDVQYVSREVLASSFRFPPFFKAQLEVGED